MMSTVRAIDTPQSHGINDMEYFGSEKWYHRKSKDEGPRIRLPALNSWCHQLPWECGQVIVLLCASAPHQ